MYDDEMTTDDLFTGDELREMDRDTEYRLDAEDEARDAAAAAAEEATTYAGDDEPWDGLADGEER